MQSIRIIQASTNVLEHILCHDSCDVDLRNRLNGDTPLHIAVRQRWEGMQGLRLYLGECSRPKCKKSPYELISLFVTVESLLEAGADTK